MNNWQWTEGGFLKDNNKETVLNLLCEDGGLMFREKNPKNCSDACYEIFEVMSMEGGVYALKGFVDLKEWENEIIEALDLENEIINAKEYIYAHPGIAVSAIVDNYSIFELDTINYRGQGQYSLNLEDFRITKEDLSEWLDKLGVFKDNRTLADFDMDIEIIEIGKPTPYGNKIEFKTNADVETYLLNKMNEEYDISYDVSDLKHFECFYAAEYPPVKTYPNVIVGDPMISAQFKNPIEYGGGSFYSFDIPLSIKDLRFIKNKLSDIEMPFKKNKENIER